MDMGAAQICCASHEFQLTEAAIAELGRWYGIPTWGYAGCSDAKVMDEQAALEAMLSVLMARFSGINLIHEVHVSLGASCNNGDLTNQAECGIIRMYCRYIIDMLRAFLIAKSPE